MRALSVYRNLDDSQRNGFVTNSLLEICAESTLDDHSQNEQFMETMEEMLRSKQSFDRLLLIRCLKKHCKVHDSTHCNLSTECLSNLLILCEESRDIEALCVIMGALIKRSEPRRSLVLETAKRVIPRKSIMDQISGFSVDKITILISFHGEIGDIETAQILFDSVPVSHRDSVCIGAMMDALSRNGRYSECLALFEATDFESSAISEVVHCVVLNCYSHSGRPLDALYLFAFIPSEHRLNPRIVAAVIDAMARSGHLDAAERIYAEHSEPTKTMHHRFKMNMMLSILSSCRRLLDQRRGMRIFEKMKRLEAEHGIDDEVRSSMHSLMNSLNSESARHRTMTQM